jgi:hypothetical protein
VFCNRIVASPENRLDENVPCLLEVQLASRCLASENEVIEVRQVQEVSAFPANVQEAAGTFPEMQPQSEPQRKAAKS